MTVTHGTDGSCSSGCRCGECRHALAASQRLRRARNKALLPVSMKRLDHGNPSTYNNHGCRCIHCTVAWRDHCAERKAKRVPPPPGDPRHGSTNAYGNFGCRCDLCRAAGTNARRSP